jgi:hypothetical protein
VDDDEERCSWLVSKVAKEALDDLDTARRSANHNNVVGCLSGAGRRARHRFAWGLPAMFKERHRTIVTRVEDVRGRLSPRWPAFGM